VVGQNLSDHKERLLIPESLFLLFSAAAGAAAG
jgi:hypothetical protein